MQSAWQAYQAGNHGETARICRKVRQSEPENFSAFFLEGYAFSVLGRFEEAERLLGEAVRLNPRHLEIAFANMHERYRRGDAPDSFTVDRAA